jgi:threonine dehydratase
MNTMLVPPDPVPLEEIRAAAARVRPHIRETPLLALARGALGGDFIPNFKLELTQVAGSFKSRGAFNSILSNTIGPAGVAAASGGNHGAAVANAAGALGVKARIFVPEISSPSKIAAIRRFGAEIVIGGARYDDAQAACDAFVDETGAFKIHPFAAPATIAGQGTLGLEWAAQVEALGSALDTVLIAVGGGGLISGVASALAGRGIRIVGVEPEGSRALHAALEAGGPVDVGVESIAADSLGARNVGPLVHAITSRHVDHVVLVTDIAIRDAIATLWRDYRLLSEPGGATALAAVLSGAYRPASGERVGILLCGGNVDLAKAQEWLA